MMYLAFSVCYTISNVLEFRENTNETNRGLLQIFRYISLQTEDLKYSKEHVSQGPNLRAGCFVVSVMLLVFIFPTTKCQSLN